MMSMVLSMLSTSITAVTFDCGHIRVDKQSFNLAPLSGDFSISHLVSHPPKTWNRTVTLNICKPLRPDKDIPSNMRCPRSTRVCVIDRESQDKKHEGDDKGKHDKDDGNIESVIAIAGQFEHDGRYLDPKLTRLKTSSSNADSQKEGLRVELHGGQYPFKKGGRKQRAIIEFLCDRDRTGLEGLVDDKGKAKEETTSVSPISLDKSRTFEEDDDGKDEDDGGDDPPPDNDDNDGDEDDNNKKSLRYISYPGPSDDTEEDTLRLEWRTKYACEGIMNEDGGKTSSGHWGFFTWFIIM